MHTENLAKVLRLIEAAEASLKSAKTLLGDTSVERKDTEIKAAEGKAYEEGESQIVEGTFDGQNMLGPNEKIFPVPANYASKSKLVEGDRLKLTILSNGSFLYKQIAPIEREFVKGTLLKEDGQFKVTASNGQSYKVLLASVTYYKGNVGDEVTLIIPKNMESAWGTIEAILPQVEGDYSAAESF